MGKSSKDKAYPQVAKLNEAFKMAETWVSNMSGSPSDSGEAEFDGRPPRLGLGAKVTRHVDLAASNDPVEKKLMGKLGVGKRHSFKGLEQSNEKRTSELSEDFDDESDSKAIVFDKKRAIAPTPCFMPKRKHKASKSSAV